MRRIILLELIVFLLGGVSLQMQAQYGPNEIDSILALRDRLHNQWVNDSTEVDSLCMVLGLPIYDTLATGQVAFAYCIIDSVPSYRAAYTADIAATISTNKVWPSGGEGFSLAGEPILIGMWDEGKPLTAHQEFEGRLQYKDEPRPEDANNPQRHSTGVAGILIAKGVDGEAQGMAYEASVWAYDFYDDKSEIADVALSGIQISNHSYGDRGGWEPLPAPGGTEWLWSGRTVGGANTSEDREFGRYYDAAKDIDDMLYKPLRYNVIVKAAGNHRNHGPGSQVSHRHRYEIGTFNDVHDFTDGGTGGYDCLTDFSVAKNVIVVGAVEDIPEGYNSSSDVVLSGFSSTGPTDDGRIKPDLVANGVGVKMPSTEYPYTATDLYYTDDGTSMAAPSVTGSLALLMELYKSLYPGELPLLSSTWKGILIHTADEAGADPGPDYKFGWGLMNTLSAADLLLENKDQCCRVGEYTIFGGGEGSDGILEYNVESDGTEPLKVTICWTDPPFTGYRQDDPPVDWFEKTLVNDLDLTVVGPEGGSSATYYPWKLDRLNPSSAATRSGANNIDNVEQVVIDEPDAGIYTIKVDFGSTGLVGGLQRVSMVVTGTITENIDLTLDESIDNTTTRYSVGGEITTQTAFDVGSNSDVTLVAGERIVMKDGSRVEEGNVFYAYICDDDQGGSVIKKPAPPRYLITGEAPSSEGYALLLSYPNPASALTTVKYHVPEIEHVRIHLIDESGKHVAVVVDQEEHPAGTFDVNFNVSTIPAGAYYLSLETSFGRKLIQRVLVVR